MNVFVLNTGRCGSVTFFKACTHIVNFSAAHESRWQLVGDRRLDYPDRHIEVDNRLAWFLGRLDRRYGDGAFYVHLVREREATALSFSKREHFGIMRAYREGILMGGPQQSDALELARDYVDTVEANIALFLKDKRRKMTVRLETAKADFVQFWASIDAQGDLQAALNEWDTVYNQPLPPSLERG